MDVTFESILQQKMNPVVQAPVSQSDFYCTLTRTENTFRGSLMMNSQKGKLFATAVATDLSSVARALSEQISKQLQPSLTF
jgi:hypothetical protein